MSDDTMKFLKTIWCYFWRTDIRGCQFWIASASLLWAMLLFWPGETFSRPVYAAMAEIAREEVWASIFAFYSITEMMKVFKPTTEVSLGVGIDMATSVIGCAVWAASAVCLFISPLPGALAPHFVMAVGSWWILVRTDFPKYVRRVTDPVDGRTEPNEVARD